jgi:hypothetical protein
MPASVSAFASRASAFAASMSQQADRAPVKRRLLQFSRNLEQSSGGRDRGAVLMQP